MTAITDLSAIQDDATYVVQLVDLSSYSDDRLASAAVGKGADGLAAAVGSALCDYLSDQGGWDDATNSSVPYVDDVLAQAVRSAESDLSRMGKPTDRRSQLQAEIFQIDLDKAKADLAHYGFFSEAVLYGNYQNLRNTTVEDSRVADLVAMKPDAKLAELLFDFLTQLIKKDQRHLLLLVQKTEVLG